MLKVTKEKNGSKLVITLEGRIDSTTSPELEESLAGAFDGINDVTFDIAKITYISSAGLRVLLASRKAVGEDAAFVIKNAVDEVRDIFEVTGLDKIINLG